jgi:hypothetical protein
MIHHRGTGVGFEGHTFAVAKPYQGAAGGDGIAAVLDGGGSKRLTDRAV